MTGASSTPQLLDSSCAVSGILDHPLQCAIAHKAGDDNSAGPHVSIFTYSKSPGLLSMPTFGAEIQEANVPGSVTGAINDAMKSPSSVEGIHSPLRLAQVASSIKRPS